MFNTKGSPMKTAICKMAIIAIVIFFTNGIALGDLTVSQISKQYSSSVVTIVALDENDQPLSLGSGFFINASGDIATNHHVLEGSSKAILKTIGGENGEILEIIKDDSELDLIVAKTSLTTTSPIPLGDSDTITVGEDIIAIGNPAGLEGTVSKGIISGVRNVEGMKFIQITAPISPGSSGGPVFNMAGKVIGVATAYIDVGQNLNFAMPVNYLKTLKTVNHKLASLPKMSKKSQTAAVDQNLVTAFNVERSTTYQGGSANISFSVRNTSRTDIRNIKILILWKSSSGEMLHFTPILVEDTIPSLQTKIIQRNFMEAIGSLPYAFKTETRIIDYEILTSSGLFEFK